MIAKIRSNALAWADAVVEGTFFVMQIYLTEVWNLSFFAAATFLNIWGGIYRILPVFFVFVAGKSRLLNFVMLGPSGVFSTTGLVLITYTAFPGYRCHKNGEAECVGHTEKAVFVTGMAFIALGRATRFASSQPFPDDDDQEDPPSNNECPDQPQKQIIVFLRFALVTLFFVTPAVGFFAFPYIKKWHILFGVSTIFTALATLSHLSTFRRHKKHGPNPSSIVSQSLGFGYKAALKFFIDRTRENGGDFRSPEEREEVRAAAVSFEELYKIKHVVIRTAVLYSTCILCGIVSSVGSTYFVEQAARMDYSIGRWKPPLQLLQLLFTVFKHLFTANAYAITSVDDVQLEVTIDNSMLCSIACCAVAAAVERRRVHAVRRHNILDDAMTTPMSAFWLIFQMCFLGMVEALADYSITKFHERDAPKWMKRYGDCLSEAVTGVGYMCGALLVYVVGEISETGGGKNWFQHSLNRSRLDRYYWVLTTLCAVYLFVSMVVMEVKGYRRRKSRDSEAGVRTTAV